MTRYTGNHCPVCEQAFTDEDDIVVCPDCGSRLWIDSETKTVLRKEKPSRRPGLSLDSLMEKEKRKADRDQNRKLRRPGFKKWMNNMSNADIRLIAREINSRVGVWII